MADTIQPLFGISGFSFTSFSGQEDSVTAYDNSVTELATDADEVSSLATFGSSVGLKVLIAIREGNT